MLEEGVIGSNNVSPVGHELAIAECYELKTSA